MEQDTPIEQDKPSIDSNTPEEQKRQTGQAGWYVIHTYAGYEDQVAENLLQRAETLNLKDYIFEVIVPKEKQVEIKNGKRKTVEKRSFPGYVFVNMIVTDESWYVVRNTPSVTGFLGSGVRPTPIPQSEVDSIKIKMDRDEPEHTVDLQKDDLVRISDGPLKGYEGKVTEVDAEKGKVKISVLMFGRETPVNMDFLQVKKT
jgi:transcriptional antiterminator NusG